VRIDSVRAGALPLPFTQFREEIAERAAKAGVPIRWTETEGVPVALLRLPLDPREFKGKHLVVEELRLSAGELVVAGRTEPPPDAPAENADAPPAEAPQESEPIRAAWPPVESAIQQR
jgi:hypothetical protein